MSNVIRKSQLTGGANLRDICIHFAYRAEIYASTNSGYIMNFKSKYGTFISIKRQFSHKKIKGVENCADGGIIIGK